MDMQNIQDAVNRPSHYTQYEGFEVMDVCTQLRSADGSGNWFRGNVFKYLARAGWKNPTKELEDLEMAAHYLQREIDRIKGRPEADAAGEVVRVWNNSVFEEPKPWTSCPECKLPLLDNGSCIRGHVWKEGEDHVWGPSTVTATVAEKQTDYEHCPECGLRLESGAVCLRRHGWMRKMGDDYIWISHSGGKWNGHRPDPSKLYADIANPQCPVCNYDLIPDPAQEGLFYCEQGHGRMKFTLSDGQMMFSSTETKA